LSIFW